MTELQLRQSVVNIINGWVGATKGSAAHREILSLYNNFDHAPETARYTVQPYDDYCDTTASAAYIKAGMAKWTGTECGVERHVNIAKRMGIWVENDAYVPKIGDSCVYDWQDDGKGDCTGWSDHIGIVTEAGSNDFIVTEGNMSGGVVGKRRMAVNGRYIRGYICPNFAAAAAALSAGNVAAPAPVVSNTASKDVGTLHTVQLGEYLGIIAQKYGVAVADLTAWNGLQNPNIIKVGWRIGTTQVAGAIAKLANLGVIGAPDYWLQQVQAGKVKYLEDLLTKAASKITKNSSRCYDPENGIDALIVGGVIGSPDYWRQKYKTTDNLGSLLMALGGAVAAS